MKCFSLLSLVGLALASNVVDLTSSNFKTTVGSEDIMLVEFFAPWCGHCKSLAPKYEEAATALKDDIVLAKVDCTQEADLCQEYGIRGYPTMKVFRDGKAVDYAGAREADAIVSYMKKQKLPSLSVLEDDKIEEFSTSDKVVIVGFFEDESEEKKSFQEVANSLRDDFLFGASSSADAAKQFGVEIPSVVLFKKFDEGKNIFSGDFKSSSDITEFIKTSSVPVMDDIGPENYSKYVESGLPLALLFVSTEDDRKTFGPDVEKIAKRMKGKINFVYIDANKYGGYANNVNLKLADGKGFAIQEPSKNKKYPYTGELNFTDLLKYTEDFVAGNVEPSLKSQEVPESQDGPVTVLVGKNFKEIVHSEKDVLVEFYAPWCGHCKKLAPIYDDLGSKLKGNNNIIIAKMDATENDVPDSSVNVSGFPTIVLFKADGEVVTYSGDRTYDDFVSFLKKEAVYGSSVKISAEGDGDKDGAEGHDEL